MVISISILILMGGNYTKEYVRLIGLIMIMCGVLTMISKGSASLLEGLIDMTGWVKLSKTLVYVISGLILLENKDLSIEYGLLAYLGTIGLILMMLSEDLMVMYLAIEVQALVYYVLIGFNKTSSLSVEGGMKYFIIGGISSSILLLGIGELYNETGAITWIDLEGLVLPGSIGLKVLCVGLLIKLGVGSFLSVLYRYNRWG